jgi:hypothetical protein
MPRARTSMGDLNYKGPRQPPNLRPFSIKYGRATLEAGPKKVVGHLGPERGGRPLLQSLNQG